MPILIYHFIGTNELVKLSIPYSIYVLSSYNRCKACTYIPSISVFISVISLIVINYFRIPKSFCYTTISVLHMTSNTYKYFRKCLYIEVSYIIYDLISISIGQRYSRLIWIILHNIIVKIYQPYFTRNESKSVCGSSLWFHQLSWLTP